MKRIITGILLLVMMGCAPYWDPTQVFNQETITDLIALYQQFVNKQGETAPPPVTPPPVTPPVIPDKPPVEVPVLTADTLVVMDLSTLPDTLRKVIGTQSRDPLILYAFACSIGAKVWACQDSECEGMMQYEGALAKWYDNYMVWVEGVLKQNPLITATIITNDGNHRFGYWIGPVVADRLSAYQSRLTMEALTPESEYR